MNHDAYCAQFLKSGDTILDIGAGRGHFIFAMAKRGFAVYGIETNSTYIALIEKQARSTGLTITIKQGKAEQLLFSDNQMDFINAAEVTEHVDDPRRMCQEMYRVLKPGGHGYISFHNRFGGYDYHYHLFFINWLPRVFTEPVLQRLGKQKSDSPAIGRQKLVTMHYYTYGQALSLLKKIGFTVYDIRREKIKRKFGWVAPLFLLPYWVLRACYFNTFHLLLEK